MVSTRHLWHPISSKCCSSAFNRLKKERPHDSSFSCSPLASNSIQDQLQEGTFCFHSFERPGPTYISDLLSPHTSSKSLRSSDLALLVPPRARRKRKGDPAFAS
ncbi:hypothetical protein LDENG_00153650 [Lucifuga dentata]|nr:hypothetical protein LDENG_00153650 [Lucifuga dentata]